MGVHIHTYLRTGATTGKGSHTVPYSYIGVSKEDPEPKMEEGKSPNEEEVEHIKAKEVQSSNDMSSDELRNGGNKITITNPSYLIQSTVAVKIADRERAGSIKEGETRLTKQESEQSKGRKRKRGQSKLKQALRQNSRTMAS